MYTYVYTYTQMYIYICRTVLPTAPPLRGGRRAGNDTTAALCKFSDEADKRRSSSSHVLQEQEQKPQTTPTCPTNKQTNVRELHNGRMRHKRKASLQRAPSWVLIPL